MNADTLRARAENFALSLTPTSAQDSAARRYFYEEIEGPAYLGATDAARQAYQASISIADNRQAALKAMNECLARGEYPSLDTAERRRRCYNDAIDKLPQYIDWIDRLPRPVAPGKVQWNGAPLAALVSSWTPERFAAATKEYSVSQYLREKYGPIAGALIEATGEIVDTATAPLPPTPSPWMRWAAVVGGSILGVVVILAISKRGERGRG